MKHIDPKRLEAYFDAEGSASEAREVEQHLAECDSCRREVEALKKLQAGVRSAREIDLGEVSLEGFAGTVRQRLAAGEKGSPGWWERIRFAWNVEWGTLRRAVVVACGLAVLVGAGFFWQTRRSPSPEAELPPACRIEYIEPGAGVDVRAVYSDSEVAVVWVSGGGTG